eukprot:8220531-Pyramimonas_sp.AAC.1
MHRSPTEMTTGVSGMANASKFPPLSPGNVQGTCICQSFYHTHRPCCPQEPLSNKVVSTVRIDY